MNDTQLQTLAAHIRANTDPTVVAALAIRNDVALTDWYNSNSTTLAWKTNVAADALFDAMNISIFDNLTAGKRDAWRLILSFSPINAAKVQIRTAFQDIWGANATAFLGVCTEYAKNIELVFGGTEETAGVTTALDRTYVGSASIDDISNCLNKY